MIVKRYSLLDFPKEQVQKLLSTLYPIPQFRPKVECESYHEVFFKTWICVFDGDNCIGKVALFQNPQIEELDSKTLLAGYFDSINSIEVMILLTLEIAKYCTENGFSKIIGPLNCTTWDSYRLLKHAQAIPFFLDVLHPAYYHALWENCGWQISDSYHSTEAEVAVISSEIDSDLTFHNKEIEIKPFDLAQFEEEIRSIYDLCLISFKNNRYYSPIGFPDFLEKYQKAKAFINPEFVLVAKHQNRTVGFIFCIPDLLNPQRNRLIIKTLAILPNAEYRGLGSFLTRMIYLKATGKFDTMIHALMYDSNTSAHILAKHHTTIQQYSLFEWNIGV